MKIILTFWTHADAEDWFDTAGSGYVQGLEWHSDDGAAATCDPEDIFDWAQGECDAVEMRTE